ncbi:hypothetical protein G3M48_001218 [Beauveria asiatica]|uniref:Dynamin family protein n=1 Tax=Beauveria asiatica TaxID=1069075 RepID=A0AAW0RFN6_9HYPO
MVTKLRTAHGLEELCPAVQISLLDTVDSLRSHGLSGLIPLPQIVVCGDQSSGKSSVLESLSGVPFPVHGSLCTRFPTELILRRTPSTSITISIVPHHTHSESTKADLRTFHEELEDFNELPSLIEKAKIAMKMQHAFSKDILRIEINGPDRPHLTIVDLPGLIHSENKHQSSDDIGLIKQLNDYANQIVLKLAREADPTGRRTLGVITKPDTLNAGSESEHSFLSLAQNQEVPFHLGWHVLRNRDTETETWTLQKRDAEESRFLSLGAWVSVPAESRGIASLRARLSTVLVRRISRELPNLIKEMEDLSTQCQESLDKLGMARTTADEQKEYLMKISQSYQELIQNATAGTYTDPYFADGETVVEGRTYALTRDQYIGRIVSMIHQNRGTELAGMINPGIVTELFKDLASPWEEMAERHVREVCEATHQCLKRLIYYITDSAAADTIFSGIFEPRLDGLQQNSLAKLSELFKLHHEIHPITYDQRFIKDRETALKKWDEARVTASLRDAFGTIHLDCETTIRASIDFKKLIRQLLRQPEVDMDHFAATNALDCLLAYYDTALSRFIDDVAVKVIETCLVGQLRKIMDPMSIFKLDNVATDRLAGETDKHRTTREKLQAKLKALRNGRDTCNKLAAPFHHALETESSAEGGVDYNDDFLSAESRDLVVARKISLDKMRSGHRSPIPAPEEPTQEKLGDEWGFFDAPTSKKDKKKKKRALLLDEAELSTI